MMQHQCSCLTCLRQRTFPNLSLRFFSRHLDTIDHTVVLDHEDSDYETISVVIHGNPIPNIRHADHLEYSDEEVNDLLQFFSRLKSSTNNTTSIETQSDLKLEVTFFVRPEDSGVPQEVFLGLANTIGQMMHQFFFSHRSNIVDTFFYKSVLPPTESDQAGKIFVTLSTSRAEDEDFDGVVEFE